MLAKNDSPVLAKAELNKRYQARQELARRSFYHFVNFVNPRYQWYRHVQVLASTLERVASGDIKRLMVFMQPRGGKSELTSRLFPAYYLYRNPTHQVGINSYAAELAYGFSRNARDNFQRAGGVLADNASAVKEWHTNRGGILWAAGVGGPITGRGFHVGLIDDPLKNAEEAASETIREKEKDWYNSTFYTRAEPDAAIVIILTRWHTDDLAGWLLQQELEEPESWHIVNFEAIKSDSLPVFPTSCTVEPDWRSPGEALCPERYPINKLEKIKKRIGSYYWTSLYQQQPVPIEGNLVKLSWFNRFSIPPANYVRCVQSWDCAASAKELSSYWVCTTWLEYQSNYYLIDVFRKQMLYPEGERTAIALAQKYNPNAVLIEAKSTGEALIPRLREHIDFSYSVIAMQPETDKVTRMSTETPAIEARRCWLPESAPWLVDFETEISTFPLSATQDQCDSVSQALRYFREGSVASWLEIYKM